MRAFYKAFLLMVIIAAPIMVKAQCGNKVQVTTSSETGSLHFVVEASSAFKGKLIAYKNADKQVVKEFSGTGRTPFEYSGLDNTYAYRIDVDFAGTDNFLCSNKVVDGIILGQTASNDR